MISPHVLNSFTIIMSSGSCSSNTIAKGMPKSILGVLYTAEMTSKGTIDTPAGVSMTIIMTNWRLQALNERL